MQRDEAVRLGERLLEQALEESGMALAQVPAERRAVLLQALKAAQWDDLLADIGIGNRLAAVVARQLAPAAEPSGREGGGHLAIRGTEGVVVTYARCCRPIPGDPVLGFLSAGRGIVIHTEDCPNVAKFRKHPEQWIDVHWEDDIQGTFPVALRVEVKNQRGALAIVAAAIAEIGCNIDTVAIEERDGINSAIDFTLDVRNRVHLAQLLRHVRSQEPVIRITRMKG